MNWILILKALIIGKWNQISVLAQKKFRKQKSLPDIIKTFRNQENKIHISLGGKFYERYQNIKG